MVLTTHAVAGAAVASFFPNHFVLAFCLAFVSHFALDAIPHWDYKILSDSMNPKSVNKFTFDQNFVFDILRIGTDFCLGIILSLILFTPLQSPLVFNDLGKLIVGGAFFGMLPDALQFVYSKFRYEPLVSLQEFHQWIHTNIRLKAAGIGLILQLTLITIIVLITTYLHGLNK